MTKRDKDKRVRKAYTFLLEKSRSQGSFDPADLMAATGYSASTVETYRGKQWKDLVKREGTLLRVLPEFQLLNEEEFCELMSQKRIVFTRYKRLRYSEVLTYEFLLPLTRESLLRKSLDDLFYEDSIMRRLREIGRVQFGRWMPSDEDETEDEHLRRVCAFVSRMFGGYSIGHVAGRYLAAPLASRSRLPATIVTLSMKQRHRYDSSYLSTRRGLRRRPRQRMLPSMRLASTMLCSMLPP